MTATTTSITTTTTTGHANAEDYPDGHIILDGKGVVFTAKEGKYHASHTYKIKVASYFEGATVLLMAGGGGGGADNVIGGAGGGSGHVTTFKLTDVAKFVGTDFHIYLGKGGVGKDHAGYGQLINTLS
jgi:hypothetical protein